MSQFTAPTSANLSLHAPAAAALASAPLVMTGPGGNYTTTYLARGNRMVAVSGNPIGSFADQNVIASDNPADSNSGHDTGNSPGYFRRSKQQHHANSESDSLAQTVPAARPRTLIDRLLGIDRVELSGAAMAASNAPPAGMQKVERNEDAAREEVSHHSKIERQTDPLRSVAATWLGGQRAWLESALALFGRLLAQIIVSECRQSVLARGSQHADAEADAGASSDEFEAIDTFDRFDARMIAAATSMDEVVQHHSAMRTHRGECEIVIYAQPLGARARGLITSIGRPRRYTLMEDYRHESHAQATADFETHPRIATHSRLFADDAGTRRRIGGQQGDRVRARRNAHQKGRAQARSKQGTLFIHL